jgi:hypothetical protein
MAVTIKITVLLDVTPCSRVDVLEGIWICYLQFMSCVIIEISACKKRKFDLSSTGFHRSVQCQSHVKTDGQSVSPSWCRAKSGAHDQILITI